MPPPFGTQPPKKSSGGKIALFVIGGIVALCLVLGVIGAIVFNSNSSHSTTATAGNRGDKGPTVGMNQPARDGAVEFTVKSVKCDVATVGSGDLISTAQGQFCLATIGIKNVSNTSWTYETAEDTAYTAGGQEYHTDIEATVRANDEEKFFNKIFPNASGEVVVVWDIPKDQKITKIRLEEGSLGTDGALFTVS